MLKMKHFYSSLLFSTILVLTCLELVSSDASLYSSLNLIKVALIGICPQFINYGILVSINFSATNAGKTPGRKAPRRKTSGSDAARSPLNTRLVSINFSATNAGKTPHKKTFGSSAAKSPLKTRVK